MIFWQITALLEKYEATLKTPVKELPDDAIDEILYGSDERIKIKSSLIGTSSDYSLLSRGSEVHSDVAGKKTRLPQRRNGQNSLPRQLFVRSVMERN